MSTLPARISIKRRRQDEPVDTLYFEHGTGPERKRRVTDFYFQRLRDDAIAPLSKPQSTAPSSPPANPSHPGIPPVRWTSPGDDLKDYQRLKQSIRAKSDSDPLAQLRKELQEEASPEGGGPSAPAAAPLQWDEPGARRFHLTRHLSSILSTGSAVRVQKNTSIRPPLPTFVERHTGAVQTGSPRGGQVVDKIVEVKTGLEGDTSTADGQSIGDRLQDARRTATQTFVQADPGAVRTGTSIRDHPSTWDKDSDQLADELAALAMELDPDAQAVSEPAAIPTIVSAHPDAPMGDREEDYIYETYVRVPMGGDALTVEQASVGILVIDQDDQDLWQKYIDSDDESEWDDEDSNAEDNPSNDYPEDEVSSDDEYGYNSYKYRPYGSDNEAFDEDEND